jgi:hypothetical protein
MWWSWRRLSIASSAPASRAPLDDRPGVVRAGAFDDPCPARLQLGVAVRRGGGDAHVRRPIVRALGHLAQPHSELFRLLRRTRFDVEDLVELYAPDGAQPHEYYSFVTPDWARKWPAEEIWAARKLPLVKNGLP